MFEGNFIVALFPLTATLGGVNPIRVTLHLSVLYIRKFLSKCSLTRLKKVQAPSIPIRTTVKHLTRAFPLCVFFKSNGTSDTH